MSVALGSFRAISQRKLSLRPHTAIILSKMLTEAVKQNFTVAGPASLLIETWEDSPVYLARRAYYHYLGETEISEEKAEEFTQVRALTVMYTSEKGYVFLATSIF